MKEKIKSGLLVFVGITMVAIAISMFLVPNKIVNGGASGLATIIYYTIGIKPSISNAIINGILLLFSLICFGKKFVAKTVSSIVGLTILIEVFSYFPPVTDNVLLASIFGAVLYGMGIGIVLCQGSTTGGTDIMGRLIQHNKPQWKIGKILLGVDFFVIFLSLLTFKTTEAALYGVLALFLSTNAIDWLMKSLNISKLAFVVTDQGQVISDFLISTSPRGVTLVNATGGYTHQERQVLICALKESELPEFQRKILSIDKEAFIIYSESQQIVGNGFYIYG
jgi:uncharacterized membrane-anchored protein YitT (DUF2179 family)